MGTMKIGKPEKFLILLFLCNIFIPMKAKGSYLSLQSSEILPAGKGEIWAGVGGCYGKRMGLPENFYFAKGWYRRNIGKREEIEFGLYIHRGGWPDLTGDIKLRVVEERKWIPDIVLGGRIGLGPVFMVQTIFGKTFSNDLHIFGGIKESILTNFLGGFLGLRFKTFICGITFMKSISERRSYLIDFGMGVKLR